MPLERGRLELEQIPTQVRVARQIIRAQADRLSRLADHLESGEQAALAREIQAQLDYAAGLLD